MSLIKNSLLNFAGFLIPSLIAIPVLGVLARLLSIEEFGLFLIVFAIIGYAGIFDAGLTRAVIRYVSVYRSDKVKVKNIISTSSGFILILGAFAGVLLYFLNEKISSLIGLSDNLSQVFTGAVIYVSLTIPVFLIGLVFQSYFDGVENFKISNYIKILSNSLLSLFPLLSYLYFRSLEGAIIGLLIGRTLGMIIGYFYLVKSIGYFGIRITFSVLKELLSYGSWLTVSNIVSPIMVYFDRFIISSMLGPKAVAFYAAPSEAVSRLLNIPGSISRALFPYIANQSQISNHKAVKKQALSITFIISFLLVFPLIMLSEKIIDIWMGQKYIETSAAVLKVLLVGFLFNSVAQIPFSSIQAKGHSKIAALIHLIELVPYLGLLYLLIYYFGVLGAAISWSIRVILDCVVFYITDNILQEQ